MQVTVRDLMTREPVTVRQGTTIQDTQDVFLREDAAEVYVTGELGQLLGVVPDYEMLKAQMNRMPLDECIETLMSSNVAMVSPDADMMGVAPVFREGRSRHMAVVEEGRLVGQISRRDVFRMMVACDRVDETIEGDKGQMVQPTMRRPRFLKPQNEMHQQR